MSGFPQKFYHAVFWPIRILMGFAHPIVQVRGLENIPDGPAVICCNHSSFSDAIWVIVCSHQKRIFRTMAKKELFSHRVLGWFITKLGAFPVDREANDIHAVKTALGVLREGDKLLIFPEGTRVREGDVSHPHVGAVTFACRTDAPMTEEIRRKIDAEAPRFRDLANGFAIGTGNSIPDYVPAENYLAMLEAVNAYRDSLSQR